MGGSSQSAARPGARLAGQPGPSLLAPKALGWPAPIPHAVPGLGLATRRGHEQTGLDQA